MKSYLFLLLLIPFAYAQECILNVSAPSSFNLIEDSFFTYTYGSQGDLTLIPISSRLNLTLIDNQISYLPSSRDSGTSTYFFVVTTREGCYGIKKVTFKVYALPEIFDFSPQEKRVVINEGQAVQFFLKARSENGKVDYAWYLEDINVQNDTAYFGYASNFSSSGNKHVKAVVTDQKNLTRQQEWVISVSDVNRPPYMKFGLPSLAITEQAEEDILDLDDYVKDPDEDILSFSPSDSEILDAKIGEKGTLSLFPKQFGSGELTITADDGNGGILEFIMPFKVAKKYNSSLDIEMMEENKTCEVEMVCGDWGECLPEGIRLRECHDECTNKTLNEYEDCDYGATCFDSLKNQGETGVDCGGPCDQCPSCDDGIMNQGEEGIDCGGPCRACPSCFDLKKNQDESDVDCGGVCASCQDGAACIRQSDCQSMVCEHNLCLAATCQDSRKNQGEEKIDCGGPCSPCPTCVDEIKNQGEEDVDCGGPCVSCTSCTDGIKNQGEVFSDCGGPCPCYWLEFYQKNKIIILISLVMVTGYLAVLIHFRSHKKNYFLAGIRMFHSSINLEQISLRTRDRLKTLQQNLNSLAKEKALEEYAKIMGDYFGAVEKIRNVFFRRYFAIMHQVSERDISGSAIYKIELNEKIETMFVYIDKVKEASR